MLDSNSGVGRSYAVVVFKRCIVSAVVFDNKDLVIVVRCAIENRAHAGVKHVDVIFVGYDYADERMGKWQVVFNFEAARVFAANDMAFDVLSCKKLAKNLLSVIAGSFWLN